MSTGFIPGSLLDPKDTSPEANRARWVEALRSGKFRQAQNRLRLGNAYCCLGVACVLAGIEAETHSEAYGLYLFDDEYLTLPDRAQEWLGVQAASPRIDFGDVDRLGTQGHHPDSELAGCYVSWPHELSALNDGGFTFNQIADLIEYFGITE